MISKLVLALVALGLLVSKPLAAQEVELNPYLYYYSDYLGTFVIERADGSDSYLADENIIQHIALPEADSTNDAFPHLSENGHYEIAADHRGLITITDYLNNTTHQLNPHPARHPDSGMNFTEVIWYGDSTWVIAAQNANPVGGGAPRGAGVRLVLNVETGFRRDLNGFCASRNQRCANWIPETINISQLGLKVNNRLEQLEASQQLMTSDYVMYLSWSPDSQQLAISHGGLRTRDGSYKWVGIWEVADPTRYSEMNPPIETSVEWQVNPLGGYQLVSSSEAITELGFQTPFAITSDGNFYIAYSSKSQIPLSPVSLFATSTGLPVATIEDTDYTYQPSFSFQPNGTWLAYSNLNERVRLIDPLTGKMLLTLPIWGNPVAFSPDGLWVAVGAGWEVRLYTTEVLEAFVLTDQ